MHVLEKVKRTRLFLCVLGCLLCVMCGCQNSEKATESDNAQISEKSDDTYATEEIKSTESDLPTENSQMNEKLDDVLLYLPDSEAEYLIPTKQQAVKTPEGIVKALVDNEVLPEGTKVNYFVLKDNGQYISLDDEVASMSENLTAELDLSDEFLEAVQHTGTAGEIMIMGSIVNSFCENFNLKEIMLTSNENVVETGHNIYDEPLSFFEEQVQ